MPKLADPVMFPVEVRVAADDIWLSTAYGRDSAYIAIHQYTGLPYEAYFALFESIVARVGGRPHWGKLHTLDAGRLRELYPRFGDFIRVRAEADPAGRFTNPYLDRVLGPAPGQADWAVCQRTGPGKRESSRWTADKLDRLQGGNTRGADVPSPAV